jgi:hypothetical protein
MVQHMGARAVLAAVGHLRQVYSLCTAVYCRGDNWLPVSYVWEGTSCGLSCTCVLSASHALKWIDQCRRWVQWSKAHIVQALRDTPSVTITHTGGH